MMSLLPLATEGGSSGATTVVGILGAGGVGAILAAIVAGLFSKRKLGAEATEIITNAAAGVVTSMESQLERSEKDRRKDQARHEVEMTRITAGHADEMTKMAQAHVNEREAWRKVLQLHVAWDMLAISKLADENIELPAPPPVTPDRRFVDDHGYPL